MKLTERPHPREHLAITLAGGCKAPAAQNVIVFIDHSTDM